MKDTKEVILFFGKNTVYDSLNVAKEIQNRFTGIGNPTIIPDQKNNTTIILFNENDNIKIQLTFYEVNLVIKNKLSDNLSSYVFDIVDMFEEIKCKFNKIGMLINIMLSPKEEEILKNKIINGEMMDDVSDFNLSFYRELKTSIGNINFWEKIIKDSKVFDDVLYQFDFNSKKGEKLNIDMKYIKELIKIADENVDRKVNF